MVTFLKMPAGPPALTLRPQERAALARAPRREDPKRARALEGGAGAVLGLISKGEGTPGPGGYDLVYGFDRYRPAAGPPVTGMTLDEVAGLQREMLRREKLAGAKERSTAFGKYQITRDTRADIQKAMGLPGSAVATPGLQDRMGRELLNMEGFDDFLRGGKTTAQKMQKNLAGRFSSFAAGPDDYPASGDRSKKAPVTTADIQRALADAKAEHERYLQQDPYITQRIEEGYLPDVTRWR